MPNHFATQILCRLTGQDEEDNLDFDSLKGVNLCEKIFPMPEHIKSEVPGVNPPWLQWAVEHWGTKWGTYRTSVTNVPGDNFSLIWVSFESAWSPPKKEVMRKIFDYLRIEYRLSAELVMYFEPSDESYRIEIPQ